MLRPLLSLAVLLAFADVHAAAPQGTPPQMTFVALAAAQGHDCGAPDTLAVCRVRKVLSPEVVRQRLRSGIAWQEGDTLTVAYAGAARSVALCCTVRMPMSRLPATDLWVLSVRIKELAAGRISLRFVIDDSLQQVPVVNWRGPTLPPAVAKADRLRGRLLEDTMPSTILGVRRALTVYLPEGEAVAPRPVVYLADGYVVRDLAAIIDTLISAGRIPPVVLVGAHTAPRSDPPPSSFRDDPRFFEYVAMWDARFPLHERFFVEELPPWSEAHYGVSKAPADRAIWGVSNSGYFAIRMGLLHPALYGHVLAFSPAGDRPEMDSTRVGTVRPTFRIAGGTLEGSVLPAFARGWEENLRKAGFVVHRTLYVGGHETLPWWEEFPTMLLEIFGRSPR